MEPRGEAMDNATPTAQKKPDRTQKKKTQPEDLIEFRLQYFERTSSSFSFEEDSDYAPDEDASGVKKKKRSKINKNWFDHYFRCPKYATLDTIRKLLVQKFSLGDKYEVVFFNEFIGRDLTMSMRLSEIAIEAGWRHRRPLRLWFTITRRIVIEPMPQLEQEDNENVETVINEAETPPPPMLTPSVPVPSTVPQQKPQMVMVPPQLVRSAPGPQKRRRTSQNQLSPQAMPQVRMVPPQVMAPPQPFSAFTQQQINEMFARQQIFMHQNRAVIAAPPPAQDSKREQSPGYARLVQQQQQLQQQQLQMHQQQMQQHQMHQIQQQMKAQQMQPHQMQAQQMQLFPVHMAPRVMEMGPAAKMPRMIPVAIQQQMFKFHQQQQMKQAEAQKNTQFAPPPTISSVEVKSPTTSIATVTTVSPAPPVLSKAPTPPSPAQQQQASTSQVTPSPPSLSSEDKQLKMAVKETPKSALPNERLKPYRAEVSIHPIMSVNRPPLPPPPQVATVAQTFDDSKIDLGTMAKMKNQKLGRILKDSFIKPSTSNRPSVPSAAPTIPPSLASPSATAMMEGIHAKNVNGEVQISAPANAIDFLQHKAIVSTM